MGTWACLPRNGGGGREGGGRRVAARGEDLIGFVRGFFTVFRSPACLRCAGVLIRGARGRRDPVTAHGAGGTEGRRVVDRGAFWLASVKFCKLNEQAIFFFEA